jgi:hypothetical protein
MELLTKLGAIALTTLALAPAAQAWQDPIGPHPARTTFQVCRQSHGARNGCDNWTGASKRVLWVLYPSQSLTWVRSCPLIDPRVNGHLMPWARGYHHTLRRLDGVTFDGIAFVNPTHQPAIVKAHCR